MPAWLFIFRSIICKSNRTFFLAEYHQKKISLRWALMGTASEMPTYRVRECYRVSKKAGWYRQETEILGRLYIVLKTGSFLNKESSIDLFLIGVVSMYLLAYLVPGSIHVYQVNIIINSTTVHAIYYLFMRRSQVLPANPPGTLRPRLPSPPCVRQLSPGPWRQTIRNEQSRFVIQPPHTTPSVRLINQKRTRNK